MSSYDVQRRNLFPIIREAILKAYNEYGLGLDEDLASAETLHIFKDITAEGYRRESEVAAEIFAEIEKLLENQEAVTENQRLKEVADWIFHDYLPMQVAELKKKYIGEPK